MTNIPCPVWCTARHDDDGPRPHHGPDLGSTWGALPVRLYQPDDGARPGVMVAGDVLDEAAAHELGLALVRGAETLRRVRRAAEQAVTA